MSTKTEESNLQSQNPQCSKTSNVARRPRRSRLLANSLFVGCLPIGDASVVDPKVQCLISRFDAHRLLRELPLMDFHRRDAIQERIRAATNVDSKRMTLLLRVMPIYEPGKDDVIDYHGNTIVLERFYLMLKLESNMWILSTLGGGYSALADCGLKECAESALRISLKQLVIAKGLGDEVLLCRCYIYIGFAFSQMDRYEDAFRVLLFTRKISSELKNSLLDDLTAALYIKIQLLAVEKHDKILQSKRFQRFKRCLHLNTPDRVH